MIGTEKRKMILKQWSNLNNSILWKEKIFSLIFHHRCQQNIGDFNYIYMCYYSKHWRFVLQLDSIKF